MQQTLVFYACNLIICLTLTSYIIFNYGKFISFHQVESPFSFKKEENPQNDGKMVEK